MVQNNDTRLHEGFESKGVETHDERALKVVRSRG